MRRLAFALLFGTLAGGFSACGPDYDCGERDLPGTADCPCLPGDRCAEALVCAAGICIDESAKGTSTSSSSTSTATTTGVTSTSSGSGSGSTTTSGTTGTDTSTGTAGTSAGSSGTG